jgi:hypothetical protein
MGRVLIQRNELRNMNESVYSGIVNMTPLVKTEMSVLQETVWRILGKVTTESHSLGPARSRTSYHVTILFKHSNGHAKTFVFTTRIAP